MLKYIFKFRFSIHHTILHGSFSLVGTGVLYTLSFKTPHKKNTSGVRSSDVAGKYYSPKYSNQ